MRKFIKLIWPYYILEREDEDLKKDLQVIVEKLEYNFDIVIFIPNAGIYLHDLFISIYGDRFQTDFITIRRAISSKKNNSIKNFVFKRRWLSNIMRHVEVAMRLIKTILKLKRHRDVDSSIDFQVEGKTVLIIDDSVDTGTTMILAKKMLLDMGASDVKTACISNHLQPRKIPVDCSVYEYALLRTKNSKDYAAK